MSADDRVNIALRIDRLVLPASHRLDAVVLRRALADALDAQVAERGVPAVWRAGATSTVPVVADVAWDGRGAEVGLARVLATRLYDGAAASGESA